MSPNPGATALELWRARESEPWIAGCDPAALRERVQARHAELARQPVAAPVEITTRDRVGFVVEFLAALTHDAPLSVFFGPAAPGCARGSPAASTLLMIPTGGTTAAPRYAVHTWTTLAAAALGLQQRLGGGPIDSVCFLPLHHVSGLMQVVRSFATGGRVVLADWPDIAAGRLPAQLEGAVTSLVPTQLTRLIAMPTAVEWLRGFRAVFLGGAPASADLLDAARRERLPLAPCYGMTETAAQVPMLAPEEFLAGRSDAGVPLPHARIEIVDAAGGELLPPGAAGRIRITASSLFYGYQTDGGAMPREVLLTADRGRLSEDGHLTVLGRLDAVINTGGEKVDPAEVEAAIRATALVRDVAVIGVPDAEWGELVVALIAGAPPGTEQEIATRLATRLAPAQRPKRWVHVAALPRSEAGKIDQRQLRAMVAAQ